MQKLDRLKASLLVCFSAAAFGLMPIFAKIAYRDGANPLNFLAFRFTIAAVVLTAIAVLKRENLRLSIKQYLYLMALGTIGYSVVAGCYFLAVAKIPASLTSLVLYTYPVIVTLYSVLAGEERVEGRKFLALAIAFAGIILMLNTGIHGQNVVGLLLAGGAAFFYAIYIIFSGKLLRAVSPFVITTFLTWAAALTMVIAALLAGRLSFSLGPAAWGAIWGTALISTVLGILTFLKGLERVGPSRASILSTVEPLVTVFLSRLIFDEYMNAMQVLGGTLILTAAVLLQLPGKTRNSKLSESTL